MSTRPGPLKHIHGPCDECCELCQEAVEDGVYTACDDCGSPGHNSYGYPEWQLQEDGSVFCQRCAEKENSNEH